MLVEIAIGDAYGAGFEYAPDAMVRSMNDLSAFRQHPRHGIRPGCYTDDTQMSIAVAEAIIAGEDWTAENLARRFVAAFKRDPRQGYAGRFYDFLREVHDEREFLSRIRPDSDKSGGAMRACPVGVFDSIPEVIEKARLQAAITHNTRDGTNAAAAAALAAHYFIYRIGDKAELGSFLAQHLPGP
ncbi:ADP-ribosylglycohydrolase family protein, partial [Candidatus Sumerlaeota bacterium]|nr:ADP-ribosylglycohydrolase family protein [Candidatus Sumerlaeota bacterium]